MVMSTCTHQSISVTRIDSDDDTVTLTTTVPSATDGVRAVNRAIDLLRKGAPRTWQVGRVTYQAADAGTQISIEVVVHHSADRDADSLAALGAEMAAILSAGVCLTAADAPYRPGNPDPAEWWSATREHRNGLDPEDAWVMAGLDAWARRSEMDQALFILRQVTA